MSTNPTDLRARLVDRIDKSTVEGRALLAVLTLHAPYVTHAATFQGVPCVVTRGCLYCNGPEWPCKTIQKIADACGIPGVNEYDADSTHRYRELLSSIWLYVDWRWITTQLTTEQKELWADAVDAFGDPDELGLKVERWWRDDAPIR